MSCRRSALILAVLTVHVLPGSAAGVEPFQATRDIRYSEVSPDPYENKLDVYSPKKTAPSPLPVVVWVHGGGWYQGNKDLAVVDKARKFTRAGYVFVSTNYRLSPRVTDPDSLRADRVKFPDQPRDVADAIGWVDRNIKTFGGDPRRIVLMGHSAGGQIVSLLATDTRFLEAVDVNPGQIRGTVSLDAVGLDIGPLTEPDSKARSDHIKPVYWNAFGTPEENLELDRWRRASPLEYAGPLDPPFFFVVQNDEPLRIRESEAMARRLHQEVDPSVLEVPLTHRQINHSFGRSPARSKATGQALAFIRNAVTPATLPGKRG